MPDAVPPPSLAPGPPTSKLAKKIPAPRKTGNTSVDYEKGMERQALIDVISWLERYPEQGMSTISFIKDRVNQSIKLQGIDTTSSFGEVSNLSRIDETWIVSFISSHSDLTVDTLAKCKQKDPEVIKQIICFALHASPMCKVPLECNNKQ
eukprot:16427964-Heterocapsa_arctica.AAC.1